MAATSLPLLVCQKLSRAGQSLRPVQVGAVEQTMQLTDLLAETYACFAKEHVLMVLKASVCVRKDLH